MKCPKCGSKNIEKTDYIGKECIICKDCGFDECSLYEVYPEDKPSKKAKGRYSPYKKGGSKRSVKK